MNRRKFIAASIALAPATLMGAHHEKNENTQYLEWIHFDVLNNARRGDLEMFLETVVVPGLNKLGCQPIGVFRGLYGLRGSDVFMLVPHPTIESFLTAWDRLAETPEYREAANTQMDTPLYKRMECSLISAFSHMPTVEVPDAIKGEKDRIFEMRIYESHNRMKGTLKIEMFNEGGEIDIFRESGIHPIFFGKTLAGSLMPNLTYMVGFKNREEQDENWTRFRNSPAWNKLKADPRYKQTVSAATKNILVPTNFSQI